ncbi:MAG: ABC transporter ATP-binding protein [Pseudomonadota bacterium]
MRRLASLIDPFAPAEGPPPQTLAAFIRWGLQGAWPVLGVAAVISVLAGTIEVFTALLLGLVIDLAVDHNSAAGFFEAHWTTLLGVAAFFLVIRPIVLGTSALANSLVVGPNTQPLVLTRLHRWTLGQAVTFFDDDFAGRISQKQMQTARAVSEIAVEIINVVVFALASLIGSTLLLATIDWRVACILAVWLVGYFAMIRWFIPRVRARSKARASARATVTGQVVDTITNIKTVKLFAHADHEESAAIDAVSAFRERALDFGELAVVFRLALWVLSGTLPVLLIGATLVLWSNGVASAGDIAAAGAVAIRVAQMTGWVSFALMGIYANVGEIEDGMNTLTPPHGLTDRPGAAAVAHGPGEIHFDEVSFAYGRKVGGVTGVNLKIGAGERVGIVGASGAGKSTLVSLLMRLYDAEGGVVRVNGQDVREITQESLRGQIAMVTQETAMFNRSARDNILYGRPGASEAEMIDAARRAGAHDFVLGLEDHKSRPGYDAHLGERGVKLSGGQRQRIALARAILKDAPILVLDEATSALDSEVEAQIQDALETVMENKTVIAIAHRLSTLAQMDRIIVLDAGQIVEEGTHLSLLERDGLYARYWERQSGGFLRYAGAAAE